MHSLYDSTFSSFLFALLLLLARRCLLGGLLGHLLLARNGRLDADAAKDEADAEPLHVREAVAKGHDGEDHGEHLARDRHGDEEDGGEGGERVDCVCVEVSILAREEGREGMREVGNRQDLQMKTWPTAPHAAKPRTSFHTAG